MTQPDNAPQHEVHDAFQRFQTRQSRNRQIREEALNSLASVIDPRAASTMPTNGSPRLDAVRAVGEALGVTMRLSAAANALDTDEEPFVAIARASHLHVRRVRLAGTWWRQDGGPLLAYTREDRRPVALLPVSPTRYELLDPVRRTRLPVNDELASTLASEAYTVYRPLPTATRHWLQLMQFGLGRHVKDLRLVLLTGMAAALLGMFVPQATALLIDHAIPGSDRGIVLQLGVALIAAAFGQTLFQLAQGFALMRQHTAAGASLQAAMWDRLLKLKPSFFRQYATGDLHARVTAISTLQQQLNGATLRTLCTSTLSLLNLLILLYYNVSLALVAIVVTLVASIVTAATSALTMRHMRPLQRLIGELLGTVVQLINGVAKLRVAGAEERAFAHWAKQFSQQQRLELRIQRIEDGMTVINAMLPTLASVALFWGAVRALQQPAAAGIGGLTTGTFLAFYVAFGAFMSGATSLSNTLIDLLDVAVLWQRTKPILEAPLETDSTQTDPGRLAGRLAMDHVTFRYRAQGPAVLDDVSIHAEPGEFIALVGPSGSGKSTLLRLLLGFDTPEAGAVYYDDQALSRLDVVAVRRQLGVVLQQSSIIEATLFENIAAGGLITPDDAWEAARAAGLAEDIDAMPMGMHTFVSASGGNLSGGQRQRLLIARALVRKPKLVLLDEATSALDNRTQAIVIASLERLQVTRVVVAHRLSTIRHADRIYVMAGGRIVQQGRFPELAQQDGFFAQLMARQNIHAGSPQSGRVDEPCGS